MIYFNSETIKNNKNLIYCSETFFPKAADELHRDLSKLYPQIPNDYMISVNFVEDTEWMKRFSIAGSVEEGKGSLTGICLPNFYDRQLKMDIVSIYVQTHNRKNVDVFLTTAHELCHAYQLLAGELVMGSEYVAFKDKIYDKFHDYNDLDFEKEAIEFVNSLNIQKYIDLMDNRVLKEFQ